MTDLRTEVRAALQHALENGYEDVALEWAAEDTAGDLIAL